MGEHGFSSSGRPGTCDLSATASSCGVLFCFVSTWRVFSSLYSHSGFSASVSLFLLTWTFFRNAHETKFIKDQTSQWGDVSPLLGDLSYIPLLFGVTLSTLVFMDSKGTHA